MMTRIRSILLAGLLVLVSPIAANAVLIDMGASTVDDATALEWLDLTATVNFSVNDFLNDVDGLLSAGWQLASDTQVCGLFSNAGGINVAECENSGPSLAEWYLFASGAGTENLISLLGNTSNQPDLYNLSLGFFAGSNAGDAGFACMFFGPQYCAALGSPGGFVLDNYYSAGFGYSRSDTGLYLVRAAQIPEPGTLGLLGIGLAAIGLMRRKRRA